MTHTGSCLCGAVKFEIDALPSETGACHCEMCRKWSGGVYLAVQVNKENISFEGADNIETFASSDWAQRGFCKTCGSSLYYQVTAPGPMQGNFHIGFGSLDDPSNVVLASEIYIDKKPAAYAFAGDTTKMTEADIMAMFRPPAQT